MAIHPLSSPAPASPAPQLHVLTVLPPPPGSPSPVHASTESPIPLSEESLQLRTTTTAPAATPTHKPAVRRDSLKRHEAMLRGKEGSRRRQRWENDRLLSNPHVTPPTAADWEPRPLHPRRVVPYEYASLWDHPSFPRRAEVERQACDKVPRELKYRLKKSHGAIGLLKSLEEEVRDFLLVKTEAEDQDDGVLVYAESDDEGMKMDETDSEEEIVFISRRKKDEKKRKREAMEREKVLFESLLEDQSASFGRWLVHSIAKYYGLQSWSVTTGTPARRIAYVGIKNRKGKSVENTVTRIPKPLYLML
ncbi:hypothetical protein RUND412_008324 [Rhizina undulata]